MRGVRTHVSDPKSNNTCTTTLKNILDTLWSTPSWPRILIRRAQLFRSFFKFPTNTRQSLSPAAKTRPRYLNKVTSSIGIQYAWKALYLLSHISSSDSFQRLLSAPLAQWVVAWYLLLSSHQGTIMFHWGHYGWGRFPYSNMMRVYETCQ